MSGFIEKEIENNESSGINRFDNKINNLIAEMVKSSNPKEKMKLQNDISKAKREKTYYLLSSYLKKFLTYVFIFFLFYL